MDIRGKVTYTVKTKAEGLAEAARTGGHYQPMFRRGKIFHVVVYDNKPNLTKK